MSRQLSLQYTTWGGARRRAGRPPKGARAGVSHLRRPALGGREPVLVTLKVRHDVPNLRTQVAMAALRRAFAGARGRGLRLVHYSVQSNHVHLVVEVEADARIGRGMQGLAIRMARRLNGAVGRRGGVFADRYHARALRSPREVRNAIAYVLLNRQRHGGGMRVRFVNTNVDPCSSGAWFDGWVASFAARGGVGPPVTDAARTWLLTEGWRRHGTIDPREVPGPRR